MILEYCCGGDMAQAMTRRRQEPLDEALARALIKQLASGRMALFSSFADNLNDVKFLLYHRHSLERDDNCYRKIEAENYES